MSSSPGTHQQYKQEIKLTQKRRIVTEDESAKEEVAEEPVEDEEAPEEEEGEIDPYEGMDDDEKLWDDGPTLGQLKEWKQKYGENNILVAIIDASIDEYCIFRPLNRHEYKRIVSKVQDMLESGEISELEVASNNEEMIAEVCVIYPEYRRHDLVGTKAGFPKMIANEIMEHSGFGQATIRRL